MVPVFNKKLLVFYSKHSWIRYGEKCPINKERLFDLISCKLIGKVEEMLKYKANQMGY